MSFSEWEEACFKEIIEFNPRETIKKGTVAKKIGMDKLSPFQREIEGYELVSFTGGTKFRNGDTLLARITPCLENGKTAQVTILDKDEVAFGSTEYIVLREKNGKSINDFIYYLAISPKLRDIAIKSMTGTTGRQRVQSDLIENTIIRVPPIDEQKAIANILSTLDEKVEVNNQINKTLENMAQAIFKQWFVDFEFPNEVGEPYKSSGGEMVESELGMIPKGWEVKKISEIGNFKNGKGINSKLQSINGSVPIFGSNGIIGKTNEVLQKEPCVIIGRVGAYCGSLQLVLKPCWVTDNAIIALPVEKIYLPYFYQRLINASLGNLAGGSAQPLINQKILNNIDSISPSKNLIENFFKVNYKFMEKIELNNEQNIKLTNIRDTLLPKLMSGEIRVPLDSAGEAS